MSLAHWLPRRLLSPLSCAHYLLLSDPLWRMGKAHRTEAQGSPNRRCFPLPSSPTENHAAACVLWPSRCLCPARLRTRRRCRRLPRLCSLARRTVEPRLIPHCRSPAPRLGHSPQVALDAPELSSRRSSPRDPSPPGGLSIRQGSRVCR